MSCRAALVFSLFLAASVGAQHQLTFFKALVDVFNGLYVNEYFAFEYDFPSTGDGDVLGMGKARVDFLSNVTLLETSKVWAEKNVVHGVLELRHNDNIVISPDNGNLIKFPRCLIQIKYFVVDMTHVHQDSVTVSDCDQESNLPDTYLQQLSEALTVQAKKFFSFGKFMSINHAERFSIMRQAVGAFLTWQD